MRAILLVLVMGAWLGTLSGAVGLTVFLVVTGVRAVRRKWSGVGERPKPPAPGTAVVFTVYAVLMALVAGIPALLGIRESAQWQDILALAALPGWAAITGAATAIVMRRRARMGGELG